LTRTRDLISQYKKAIDELEAMGLKRAGFAVKSQRKIKTILEGKKGLAAFDISTVAGVPKTILSTSENWALTSSIIARCEDVLDEDFIGNGREWINDLHSRAYKEGNKYALGVAGSHGHAVEGLTGFDAQTLLRIRQTGYKRIKGLAADQIEFLRNRLTGAVIQNRPWTTLQREIVRDGKIPALITSDGKLIEMETRIETVVRSETGQISELGNKDKAKAIYGSTPLFMKWHIVGDGRTRDRHLIRANVVRSLQDWETKPFKDGRIIMPAADPNCRCRGEYGSKQELEAA